MKQAEKEYKKLHEHRLHLLFGGMLNDKENENIKKKIESWGEKEQSANCNRISCSESPEAKRIDFIIKNAKSFIILDSVFIYENIENDKYFMGIFEKQKTIWSESKKNNHH